MNLGINQKNPSWHLMQNNRASKSKKDLAFGMKITLPEDVYLTTKKGMHEVATEIDPTDDGHIYQQVVHKISILTGKVINSINRHNKANMDKEAEVLIDAIKPIYQKDTDTTSLKIAAHIKEKENDSFANAICTTDNADEIAKLIEKKIDNFRMNTLQSDNAFYNPRT